MADNPSRGDATKTDLPELSLSEQVDKETDPDKVASVAMSLKGILAALSGKSSDSARSAVGEQSFSPSSGSSADVNPSSNGVSNASCDILIKNTGIEILWITTDGTTDSGFELKPDDDTGELFFGHTSTDADLAVRTDSGASSAGAAEALYRE